LVDCVASQMAALLLYMLFLVIIVVIGLAQFPFRNLTIFFDHMSSALLGLVDVFLAGMIFSYISIHAIYILALIPIPFQKTQSFEERWREVKKHAQLLRSKYSNEQLRKILNCLIVCLMTEI